jgi:ribonuclease D
LSERVQNLSWIATADELAGALTSIGRSPLAIDTEGDSLHHYPEKVCLIQLSYAGRDMLIDPLARLDLSVLQPVLNDAGVIKILHGADYDIRVLQRDFGLRISGLFDTMIAARMLGLQRFGLAALLDGFLGVQLDKRFQKADWSRRPLTHAMREYAVKDTLYLEALYEELVSRLTKLGRLPWVEEECRLLEQVRWFNRESEAEPFRKFKKIAKLNHRELAILRNLYDLRETLARERDRPPFMILRDEVVLLLIEKQPLGVPALGGLKGLPAFWQRERESGLRLVNAVREAVELPEEQLPAPRRPTKKAKRNADFEARVRKLRDRRDDVAGKLGIEPSFLASQAILVHAQVFLDEQGTLEGFSEFRTWQAGLLRPVLEN